MKYKGKGDMSAGPVLPSTVLWPADLRMRKTAIAAIFILSCLISDVGCVICKFCNLSIPFHGCLLDFGTCRTKPGQYCIKEILTKGGIQWYSVKGCTEDKSECFKRIIKNYEIRSSHCCHRPLCNF